MSKMRERVRRVRRGHALRQLDKQMKPIKEDVKPMNREQRRAVAKTLAKKPEDRKSIQRALKQAGTEREQAS